MSIQILPARLANQIAAGEVVERPASVVKELVENSLDAKATRIEIEIEKGGAKCIRIKDNGKGVCKDQLTLALSRHATSKISHLDDLEAIVSLGFRGEALASVSSVSRLTFTSKPEDQDQAWQAISEGRDMQVTLKPVAHPQGTTVEVLDLFFNTPARRRFLKTEKTEFQHIDELIRRIALSCFEVTFVLKHNGKIIRQYRAAQTQTQQEKRLASICSENFIRGAMYFKSDGSQAQNPLKISGWISDRLSPRILADVQYCYINGRMIRDKLVTHAIKQAYSYLLPEGKFPGFVIYITCSPSDVDVNVHPAKHEVRFHNARWVHDFIVSTLLATLNESDLTQGLNSSVEPIGSTQHNASGHDYQTSPTVKDSTGNSTPFASYGGSYKPKNALDDQKIDAYCDFVAEGFTPIVNNLVSESVHNNSNKNQAFCGLGEIVCLFDHAYILLKVDPQQAFISTTAPMVIISLNTLDIALQQSLLVNAYEDGEIIAQPLLLPVRIELTNEQHAVINEFESIFMRLGFVFKTQGNKLIVSRVPALLRQPPMAPISRVIPTLITYLLSQTNALSEFEIIPFCALLSTLAVKNEEKTWNLMAVQALLTQCINDDGNLFKVKSLFVEADLSLLLKGFKND